MQITERSKSEWEKFRELERQRHKNFFLPQYEKMGFEIMQDIADDVKTNSYDVVVKMHDGIDTYVGIYIEEKTRTGIWDHLLIEIMQCLRDGKVGWLYNREIDYLFDAMWRNEADDRPEVAHLIEFSKLKEFVINNFESLSGGTSTKGYGLSYFKRVKWIDLEWLKIARRVV